MLLIFQNLSLLRNFSLSLKSKKIHPHMHRETAHSLAKVVCAKFQNSKN